MMVMIVIFLFFFFQAEDGIRDGRVTGVQTCALPIWKSASGQVSSAASSVRAVSGPLADKHWTGGFATAAGKTTFAFTTRSEERRVGKEWRSRWSAYG